MAFKKFENRGQLQKGKWSIYYNPIRSIRFHAKLENTQLKKSHTILKVCFDLGKILNMQSIDKLEPVTGKLRIELHSKLGNGCCTNF